MASSPDPSAVSAMFSRIAGRYDLANHLLSMGADFYWRKRLVAAVRRTRPDVVTDLATGSGDVAFALKTALPEADVSGMDFCRPMLEEAERKKNRDSRYHDLKFGFGDILNLPLPDDSVDAITLAFGLRNLADRERGLKEMKRVLRVGGGLFVLEFSRPVFWLRPFYLFYLRHLLPRVAGWITQDRSAYEYLNESIESFPDKRALSREFLGAGFRSVDATGLTGSIVALHHAVK